MVLTESDSGSRVVVAPGEVITVRLKESPTTGFRWALEAAGGLVPARADFVGGGAVGAAGVREFVLRPAQAGTYALSFKHWREWEGDSSVIGRFDLSVVVQ